MNTFWLGTHQPHWLRRRRVPLMVSRRTLAPYRTLPRARGRWFQDSGGFTELSLFGAWTVPAAQYVDETRRFAREVGGLAHAAPQDWMCEPLVLQKTGLSVADHQARTVANYLDLMGRAPELPWVPVIQGWALADYLRCADLYARAGIDLRAAPLVGVGSVCRRQSGAEAAQIIVALAELGLKLHGFGFKLEGLARCAGALESADSLAWSYAARRDAPLSGCTTHKNCANCERYALRWLRRVRRTIAGYQPRPHQLVML